MAVVQGNLVLASDYNTLKDEVNDTWFGDPNPSMTFGNGSQTIGWGGSEVSAVVAGNEMQASEMNALIDRINIGADIVTSVGGSLLNVSVGANILASIFNSAETFSDGGNNRSSGRFDWSRRAQQFGIGGRFLFARLSFSIK